MAEAVHNPLILPDNLPVPQDDGAARHLQGMRLPDVVLAATNATAVNLSKLAGRNVVYVYPRTGRPGQDLPTGWDAHSRRARLHAAVLLVPRSFRRAEGARRQATVTDSRPRTLAYQREAVERLHLPFPILSDASLLLTRAMSLPTFSVDGMTLIKRMAWVIDDGVIAKLFYPVFPPDQSAAQVIGVASSI